MTQLLSNTEKFNKVLQKNTYFLNYEDFEQKNEAYITSLVQSVLLLREKVKESGIKKNLFINFIREKEMGLKAVLSILGYSDESLYRLISFIRLTHDNELDRLVNKAAWPQEELKAEWKEEKIIKLAKNNEEFAEGLVNLFFEGSTVPILRKTLPLFEFKKLDLSKLNFSMESLIDTIIRYKIKGSYSADMQKNPENLIGAILDKNSVKWEPGNSFRKLVGRNMDLVIPDKNKPQIIIESSYVVTTSSGMGDKASNEGKVRTKIKRKFGAKTQFIGFVDGIGWLIRKSDLKNIVRAFDSVFTFRKDELQDFEDHLINTLTQEAFKR